MTAKATALAGLMITMTACESVQTGLDSAMAAVDGTGRRTFDVAWAVTQINTCFVPPNKAEILAERGEIAGEFLYASALNSYSSKQEKYPICTLKSEPQILMAAAELSKYSVVEIANSLVALEAASGAKDQRILEIAERIKATPATQLDLNASFDELNTEAEKLAVLSAEGDGEHPPEVIEQAAIAEARLQSAATVIGQSLGATLYFLSLTEDMSDAQKEALAQRTSAAYNAPGVDSNYLNDLGSVSMGTVQRVAKLLGTSYAVARVRQKGDYSRIDKARVEGEAELSRQGALDIIGDVKAQGAI